jgi:hypothetical protein
MYRLPIALIAWFLIAVPAIAQDAAELLREADAFRLPDASVRVVTNVRLLRNGALDKERTYAVYVKPGRKSLVISRHPSEQGQKILMLDERFWIILPGSRLPVRITPMQKLLGEAATGDVASMTWSDGYTGKIAGKETVNGVPCIHLTLAAQDAGVSYQRVELYVAEQGHWPVRADLYVISGKLAKQALFTLGDVDGRRRVNAMTLVDAIQPQRKTEVQYQSFTNMDIPDKVYNPAYLARTDLGDW